MWFYHLFCDSWSVKRVNIIINTDYKLIFWLILYVDSQQNGECKVPLVFKTNWLNSKRVNLCQPYGLFVEHLQIADSFVFLHLKEEQTLNSENFLQGRPPKNDQIIGCPYGLGSSSFLFTFKIWYCYNCFNINIMMKYLFPLNKLNYLIVTGH